MYWVRILHEPSYFVCPYSGGNNEEGGNLGREFKALGPRDVSYAGRDGRMGAILEKMPSSTVMMSSDSEGNRSNDEGVSILYFDGHIEWDSNLMPRDLGVKAPLDMLRN